MKAGIAIVLIGGMAALLGLLVDLEFVTRLGGVIAVIGLGVTVLELVRSSSTADD